ncbi:tRNA-dihydrouridine synthase B [Agarivorans sp. OAG1]|uniref:tRNA-dihydrouridine synthase B n=1 Tax=Agarivorans albus MKT 106 TaxID=1331007 RepID=R9PM13_AGAAL|nr:MULTISPECIES: tRNA dihydrouridine synthase DusB [Agarivorans]MPW31524.1 tRNA dihydrouridine synthase DusB [Agarivorans sp. B2Z047]UQN42567.1 tRNA dihydrouridine synthase DusB [Agarivorans sp. B2Z047]BEU01663.1 tRNA-dihydrouridine synthase B [Agarivorans sp. OAG1]GAD02303.1 tRNA dihydrouridine synthase B [Agarivorans albus MKT 106]
MQIGSYKLDNPVILAPMAGITDQPFRRLCWRLGAGLTVSEMVSSNPRVWNSQKSLNRMVHLDECGIRSVQIAGSDPELMALAAQHNVANGAQIIDINMGCPAKKVNKKLAGSALLQQPELVKQILDAVVQAVDVPVTLKIRTGWSPEHRNALQIAKLAEAAGIQSLAIHGRTRACMYKGLAEYDTIKAVKQEVSIPIVANGDITTPEQAKHVLDYTGADAIMIGRGAQGNPWLFREINHFLSTGQHLDAPKAEEVKEVMLHHLDNLYSHYGEYQGVRIARKHVGWYLKQLADTDEFRSQFNQLESALVQTSAIEQFFE